MTTINTFVELERIVHATACLKKWHDDDELNADGTPTARQLLAWMHLVTDELDEAELESENFYFGKDSKPEGKVIECADAVIRILDMSAKFDGGVGRWLDVHLGNASAASGGLAKHRNDFTNAVRVGDLSNAALAMGMMASWIIEDAITYVPDSPDNLSCVDEFKSYIMLKNEFNLKRPDRHGGKLA